MLHADCTLLRERRGLYSVEGTCVDIVMSHETQSAIDLHEGYYLPLPRERPLDLDAPLPRPLPLLPPPPRPLPPPPPRPVEEPLPRPLPLTASPSPAADLPRMPLPPRSPPPRPPLSPLPPLRGTNDSSRDPPTLRSGRLPVSLTMMPFQIWANVSNHMLMVSSHKAQVKA